MATWIAHMRVAEYFMQKNELLNNEMFLVGNIGPDCGVPNEDWSAFTPDKNVTHWLAKDGININADDFKNNYLYSHDERYPFYLGYYLHLLTDIEWSKLINEKKLEPIYAKGLANDERYIWKIKQDWYGQDHVYLQSNPKCVFFTMFQKISEFPNAYFDFYSPEAFIRQVKNITNFYLSAKEDATRDFPYLTRFEMDSFVQKTIKVIEDSEEFCL